MNDNSRKRDGVLAISALFGVLAAAVALVAFMYSWLGAILIGIIVAIIVAIILWLGWRDANVSTGSTGSASSSVAPAAASVSSGALATAPSTDTSGHSTDATASKSTTVAIPAAAKPAAAKAAAKPAAAKAAAKPAAAKAAKAKPAVLAKAREGGPDDLKMIKGVGPVLEKALHETGVFHFDQVAAWTNVDARWFDDNVKGANGRVVRDGWIKQARILAKGGTTEFSNRVKKGGVY
jgi:predicted flap endonuclease-1-like 5' DNA nuclease